MAFQLALLEARDAVEAVLSEAAPTSPEAAMLIRIGLLNYMAGALVMPYAPFLAAAQALRHDMVAIAARFGVSFEQACNRLATLQRPEARGCRSSSSASIRRATYRSGSRRPASRSPVSADLARAGSCIPPSPCRNDPGAGGRTARRRRLPVFRPRRHPPGRAMGRSARRCTSWQWAARWRMRRTSCTPTGWTWNGQGGHRPVMPAVRSARLPQPRLPAAGAPVAHGPQLNEYKPVSV